jgi:hypothetical protein
MGKQIKPELSGRNLLFPDEVTPHVLLMFFALAIQLIAAAISGIGYSLNQNVFCLVGFGLFTLWFIFMLIIVNPHTDKALGNHRGVIKCGALIVIVLFILLGIAELTTAVLVAPIAQRNNANGNFAVLLHQMEGGFHYNDSTALERQAGENLLDGKNPYAHANIVTAMLKYNGSSDRITPLRTGRLIDVFPAPSETQLKEIWNIAIHHPSQSPPEIESKVCYPAGLFLLPAPFVAAGVKDIRIVFVVFVVAGLAYATWKIPPKKRLLFIVFAAISLELWNSLAQGETGSIVFPLLLVAWVSLDRNQLLSVITMGLAVATKQTAWFFLPFYLILLWQKSGIRSFLLAMSMIAGIFLLINAYFIIMGPKLWLSSVLAPMTSPMFPNGIGIVSLVVSGFINIRSSLPFVILEAIVFIGGAFWYSLKAKKYPFAGPMLAVLPLFFAWRSLLNYFFYVQIIVIACMLAKNEDILSIATRTFPQGTNEEQPKLTL